LQFPLKDPQPLQRVENAYLMKRAAATIAGVGVGAGARLDEVGKTDCWSLFFKLRVGQREAGLTGVCE
jgi:hypothetical protein